jgi:hypothetical protein
MAELPAFATQWMTIPFTPSSFLPGRENTFCVKSIFCMFMPEL